LQYRDAPEDEPVFLEGEPVTETDSADARFAPTSVTATTQQTGETQPGDGQPEEEDTDAADLLLVYELDEDVLVVDEHPRYHLACCRWPDQERAERLPVREARELGFTPCGQCRPDRALAHKHRSSRPPIAGAVEPA
jgi:hypothetical protein